MKAGTTEKLKFLVLKNRLRLPKYQVIGILEGLWQLTSTSAIDGAIGRFSDEEIAAWLEYEADPGELINALVNAKFLDRCAEHRLIVHDWDEHAPQYIKGTIKASGRAFLKAIPIDPPLRTPLKDTPQRDAPPSQVKSSQVKPSQDHHSVARAVDTPARETSPGEISKSLRALNVDVTSQNPVLLAWITDGFTVDQLVEAAEIANTKKPGERIPAKYLDAIVRDQATQTPKANGSHSAQWWKSDAGIEAKAREVSVTARPGESYEDLRRRVDAKLREASP